MGNDTLEAKGCKVVRLTEDIDMTGEKVLTSLCESFAKRREQN
jgi:hypothetical protein